MNSIEFIEVQGIINRSPFNNEIFPMFCETGTFQGGTTNNMAPHFSKIYSIELQTNFYHTAVERFKNFPNIQILHGDSSDKLKDINYDGNVIFFLDGHWSGYDTAQGLKDCPLLEELEIINEVVLGKAIVIIDDSRLFGKNKTHYHLNPDWTDIIPENIVAKVKDRIVYQEDVNDRFTVCLKEK